MHNKDQRPRNTEDEGQAVTRLTSQRWTRFSGHMSPFIWHQEVTRALDGRALSTPSDSSSFQGLHWSSTPWAILY